MPIERIIGIGSPAAGGPLRPAPVRRFEPVARPESARSEMEPRSIVPSHWRGTPQQQAGRWLGLVGEAQARMDRILTLAASGRTFSPAELLAMQARVAEASQTVDLAGKVVDRVSSGIRQILQTQV